MKLLHLTAALLLFASLAHAQQSFTIKGKTGNSGAPGKAYLLYKNGRDIIADSSSLQNGAFTFKGDLKEPTLARLIVDHTGVGFANTTMSADMIMMYLEEGTIHINAVDSVKKAKITGSPLNDDYTRYKNFVAGISEEEGLLAKEFEFIRNNPQSYISLYTLRSAAVPIIDVPVIEPLFNGLSPEIRGSEAGLAFKELIDKKKAVALGQTAPLFTQNDVNGQPVSLKDLKGKYVLLDFWASWCGPCRAENPHLVKAYNAFKEKGFTIISISLDRPGKKEDWLKAIEKDGLRWTHVSDLQFWENEVAKLYGIKSIPQNFLLDKEGKIVAENLRGEALEEELEKLIQ